MILFNNFQSDQVAYSVLDGVSNIEPDSIFALHSYYVETKKIFSDDLTPQVRTRFQDNRFR
jgi:hypothetical protein